MSDVLLDTGILASSLTAGMMPDLLAGTRNNLRKEFLQMLRDRTIFLSGNKFQLASNISGKLEVTSTNEALVMVNLPIIVLDRVLQADMFVEAIQSFLDPIVVRNHSMTPFNSRVPWVGKRNFLYPLYSRGLGQLEQSGIYGQWKKFGDLAKKRRQGYMFLKGRSRSIFLRKMLHVGGNALVQFSAWEPVSFEAMQYAFAFCCVLKVVGVACFAMECLMSLLIKYGIVDIRMWLATWSVTTIRRVIFCFQRWAEFFSRVIQAAKWPEQLAWRYLLNQLVFGMGLSNENPTYIFIHLDPRVTAGIEFYWADAWLTSSVIMFRDGFPLQIICIPCTKKAVAMPKFRTLRKISSAWAKYNGNLQNSVVTFSIIIQNEPFVPNDCVSYSFRNIIPWEICANQVIAAKHNFSKYVDRKDVFPNFTMIRAVNRVLVSTPTFKNLADKNFNKNYVMRRSPNRKVWYTHAVDYLPYIFLVIVPKIEMSFETLIMPFDSAMWLLTLLSVFGVTLTAVHFSRMKTTLRGNLWDKTFWTISTILGQTDGHWTAAEFLNCGGKALIFIGVWYAVIFLLGIFYQGELFSCMTAKLGPYVPP
ncbi:hypothetical protein Fcan01_10470 [Folsomia candida]|uniref:Uncharacterized protein n=1 Tax=Folsomia candida TaxID=158441 RepID=A0A226EBV1_FOLCA|nr:hypothetical protein Fcan01_10470 [Folsomia candida]